jgi:hypothetical protein
MLDDATFSEAEAHLRFAKQYNLKTWALLDQPSRTRDEEEVMLDYAHASLAHWREVGTVVNHQRGEWMISRARAVRGDGALALQHAIRCLELTDAHRAEMQDFDIACAFEAMARAHAVGGNTAEAKKFIDLAQKAGDEIANHHERESFFSEFNGGDWHGVK